MAPAASLRSDNSHAISKTVSKVAVSLLVLFEAAESQDLL